MLGTPSLRGHDLGKMVLWESLKAETAGWIRISFHSYFTECPQTLFLRNLGNTLLFISASADMALAAHLRVDRVSCGIFAYSGD